MTGTVAESIRVWGKMQHFITEMKYDHTHFWGECYYKFDGP